MKKRFLFLTIGSLSFILFGIAFVGCNSEGVDINKGDLGNRHVHHMIEYAAKSETCTEKGNIAYYFCEECEKKFMDSDGAEEVTNVEISAKGHSYSKEWSSDETYHWHSATCGHTQEQSGKEMHVKEGTNCKICNRLIPPDQTSLKYEGLEYEWNASLNGYSVKASKADTEKLTNVQIPAEINGYPVTEIGDYAFHFCESLAEIEMPDSIVRIGRMAFCGCSVLNGIKIPHAVTEIESGAFWSCSSLTEIVIPEGVMKIDLEAFRECTSLERVEIPDSVTWVSHGAFVGCDKLIQKIDGVSYVDNWVIESNQGVTEVTLPKGTRGISVCAFYEQKFLRRITIPEGVKYIGESAFNGCGKLTNVSLPKGIQTIEDSTFFNCTALKKIVLPDSLTSIEDFAFRECGALEIIDIPAGVTRIGREAFYKCGSLTEMNLSEGLVCIGESAFQDCTALKRVTLPNSLKEIQRRAFGGCRVLTNVTIPAGVSVMGSGVFNGSINLIVSCEAKQAENWDSSWNLSRAPVIWDCRNNNLDENRNEYVTIDGICYGLSKVGSSESGGPSPYGTGEVFRVPKETTGEAEIPQTVTYNNFTYCVLSVAEYAFCDCKELTSVILPEGMLWISYGAFANCSKLINVVLPVSLISIAQMAFANCSSLTGIEIFGNVDRIGSDAFLRCSSLTELVIHEGIVEIERAFRGCGSLKTVVMPKSVRNIWKGTFENCISLDTVYYLGTEEEWSESGLEGTIHENLTSATWYYYSETEPIKEGNYWHYDSDGVTPVKW